MGNISAAEQFALAATVSRKFLGSDLIEKLAVEDMAKEIETRTDLGAASLFGLET